MKKIIFVAIVLWSSCVNSASAKGDFERFGDVFRLLPVFVAVVSLGMKDYRGFAELAVGSLVTQGIIEGVKRSFDAAHKKGYNVAFAKRPCCDDYKGMPSGHAGGAFSAAGFVFYRYGYKPALPVITLALLTDASRVYAGKHSIWQVATGSLIGWGVAWIVTSKYVPKNLSITPDIDSDIRGHTSYGINVAYRF
ncbi:phosphatase PAP2 family protein [Helicobacter cappadocius]|uniref:Phosphatase PAP2 family protein n=1 Tax=Helicobacter cappadocius TaxID=3063998 RepID=A0AA90PIA7_9HELI|nr:MULTISPECIES: phosphatase PAP2 family protein [unclassified Helicobacter]MDO7252469.1 phosphatase PAP2 family protein [Helicobacter sp. faydin-H75]MDP2538336.1 phosphatase PAP2 family protein [Helicobacter sp. faydin-H76]